MNQLARFREKILDNEVVAHMLFVLHESYESLVSSIAYHNKISTLWELIFLLLNEDIRREVRKSKREEEILMV